MPLLSYSTLLLAACAASSGAYAQATYPGELGNSIKHVLSISIDGTHALDFANCSAGLSAVNADRARHSASPGNQPKPAPGRSAVEDGGLAGTAVLVPRSFAGARRGGPVRHAGGGADPWSPIPDLTPMLFT